MGREDVGANPTGPIMLKLLILLFLTLPAYGQEALRHPIWEYRVTSVIDGDTLSGVLITEPDHESHYSIRIQGIDSPETRKGLAKCDKEIENGKVSKQELIGLVNPPSQVWVENLKFDKFGGRWVADVYTTTGISVRDYMLTRHLALPYDGKRKASHCLD